MTRRASSTPPALDTSPYRPGLVIRARILGFCAPLKLSPFAHFHNHFSTSHAYRISVSGKQDDQRINSQRRPQGNFGQRQQGRNQPEHPSGPLICQQSQPSQNPEDATNKR
jgi:hypothetical protein